MGNRVTPIKWESNAYDTMVVGEFGNIKIVAKKESAKLLSSVWNVSVSKEDREVMRFDMNAAGGNMVQGIIEHNIDELISEVNGA